MENRLPAARKRRLRARAHRLKPVVIVGAAALSPGLIAAIEQALHDHALIKVRVNAEDRFERRALIEKICHACGADLIQTVGHIAVLFREPDQEARRDELSKILD